MKTLLSHDLFNTTRQSNQKRILDVLVAYEYSGIVSEAIATKGHNVTSCDLEPGNNIIHRTHIQDDAIKIANSHAWDAAIFFPPCTFLCRASTAHINTKPERRKLALEAIQTVRRLTLLNIPMICIENPIGFLSTNFCKPSQIIYPWQFGDNYSKDICLWLRGFTPLVATHQLDTGTKLKSVSNHINSRMSQALKSKIRSKFFPGIASAMATQWF